MSTHSIIQRKHADVNPRRRGRMEALSSGFVFGSIYDQIRVKWEKFHTLLGQIHAALPGTRHSREKKQLFTDGRPKNAKVSIVLAQEADAEFLCGFA